MECCSRPGEVLELCDSTHDISKDMGNKIVDLAAVGKSAKIFLIKAENLE